jgi:hypothetical protein
MITTQLAIQRGKPEGRRLVLQALATSCQQLTFFVILNAVAL